MIYLYGGQKNHILGKFEQTIAGFRRLLRQANSGTIGGQVAYPSEAPSSHTLFIVRSPVRLVTNRILFA